MQSAPAKISLVLVYALIFLQSELINATPVEQPILINMASALCKCIQGPKETNGMCQEMDQNNMYWCLVPNAPTGPNCCDGGIFPESNLGATCKNYSNCRYSGNVNNEGAANLDD